MRTDSHGRRTVLKALGVGGVAALAGCLGDDDDSENGGETEDNGGDEGFAIPAGETIQLDGYVSHWEGVAPAEIDGEENPTLILEAGEEYTFEWTNADGIVHDLTIGDANGDMVNGLQSDEVNSEGGSATLDVTASEEMAEYFCSYHASQSGEIVVE